MPVKSATSSSSASSASGSSSSLLPRSSLLVLPIALTALAIASLVPTQEDRLPRLTSSQLFPPQLTEDSPLGNGITYNPQDQIYAFGRWKTPSKQVLFHVDQDWKLKLKTLFQVKYWDYRSIDTPEYFMGAAVVKLGYANDAFLYVVDKKSPESFEKFEWQGRLPGDFGVTFGKSSIDDGACTSFTALNGESMSFCHDSTRGGWRIRAEVTTKGAVTGRTVPLKVDAFMDRQEALTVLFPLGNDTMRPAYVHKGAGSHVTGTFAFGHAKPLDLQRVGALGAIDWTRSNTLRCTRWKWASSNFRAKVTVKTKGQEEPTTQEASVGINFSKDVYDIDGESQENAIWINGKVYVLRGVSFTIPEQNPLQDTWTVATMPGIQSEMVHLDFAPKGSREDHTMLLLVESDFIQPFGHFNGTISFTSPEGEQIRVDVQNAFGVVENHLAVW